MGACSSPWRDDLRGLRPLGGLGVKKPEWDQLVPEATCLGSVSVISFLAREIA